MSSNQQKRGVRPGRTTVALIVLIGSIMAMCGVAQAVDMQARSEYVTKLEALCKPRELAIERRVDGVRGDVRSGRLRLAGTKFRKAARIFAASVRSITPVPRPEGDRRQLATWFRYLHKQEDYMRKIADALGRGRSIQGQKHIARFVHSGNLANNATLGFGFDYCAFRFSRFG